MTYRGRKRKKVSNLYSFTIKDSLATLVSVLCSCRGHGRAGIQQAVVPCQEVLCKAHGESLQHQSACTEVVNWLISAHYSDPSGTWVPFRALRVGGAGDCELGEGQASKKINKFKKNEGNERQTVVFFFLLEDKGEDWWSNDIRMRCW